MGTSSLVGIAPLRRRASATALLLRRPGDPASAGPAALRPPIARGLLYREKIFPFVRLLDCKRGANSTLSARRTILTGNPRNLLGSAGLGREPPAGSPRSGRGDSQQRDRCPNCR